MRRVFISYSHDSEEHKSRVWALAEKLRAAGIVVTIDRDRLPGGPPEGWPVWSEAQVKSADLVLVACTEVYCQRYEAEASPGVGLGAVCEARAIRQLMYNLGGFNEKFRVILFAEADNSHVPTQLEGYHRFLLYQQGGHSELVAWLRGETAVLAPSHPEPSVIQWQAAAPEYHWPLADRREEFGFFEKMITGQSPKRILLLNGASSSGKTAVLANLQTYAQHVNLRVALLDFKGCPSLDELFETLRLDLGREVLCHSYMATGTARFYQLISDLQHLSAPLLLIFDTYEQASADAQTWLESQFLPRLDQARGVIAIVAGQKVPDRGKYAWRGLAETRELKPISRVEDWMEYSLRTLGCPHVNIHHVEAYTIALGGNPGQVSALLETLARRLQASQAIGGSP